MLANEGMREYEFRIVHGEETRIRPSYCLADLF